MAQNNHGRGFAAMSETKRRNAAKEDGASQSKGERPPTTANTTPKTQRTNAQGTSK